MILLVIYVLKLVRTVHHYIQCAQSTQHFLKAKDRSMFCNQPGIRLLTVLLSLFLEDQIISRAYQRRLLIIFNKCWIVHITAFMRNVMYHCMCKKSIMVLLVRILLLLLILRCYEMAPEKCRAFNFNKQTSNCDLLYVDGKTTLRPAVSSGIDLYDLHCLDRKYSQNLVCVYL